MTDLMYIDGVAIVFYWIYKGVKMIVYLTETEDLAELAKDGQIKSYASIQDEQVLCLELKDFVIDSVGIQQITEWLPPFFANNKQVMHIQVILYNHLGDDPGSLSNTCLSLIVPFLGTSIARLSIEFKKIERDSEVEDKENDFDGAYFFRLLYCSLSRDDAHKPMLKYFSLENMILDRSASSAIGDIVALNQLDALELKGSSLCLQFLIEGLRKNRTLKILDLGKVRGFYEEDAAALAKVLEKHPALVLLSLHQVNFQGKDAIAIANMLKVNDTLQYLDFTNSMIGREELICFAKALEENKTLKVLMLGSGGKLCTQESLGLLNRSAVSFGQAFRNNNMLIYCNLMRSCVTESGGKWLVKGLRESQSLIFLFSKYRKEGELFEELTDRADKKYQSFKSNKNNSDLERRWVELCRSYTEYLVEMPLGTIAGSIGLLEPSLVPEGALLSLTLEGSASSSSSLSAETKDEKPQQELNWARVEVAGSPHTFMPPPKRRKIEETVLWSPVRLDTCS